MLVFLAEKDADPEILAQEKGLLQVSDTEHLRTVVSGIIEAHPTVLADIKSGKEQLLQFFVGQAMKELKGAGNPKVLQDIVRAEVSAR
jgi:aspartyl-tRNA(Asn)/glutamyl-tRNA(Gln) amidotransferase subunit B